jgi:hypothetical protein
MKKDINIDENKNQKEISIFKFKMFKDYCMFCTIITYILSLYFAVLSLFYWTDKYLIEVVINFLGSTVVLTLL